MTRFPDSPARARPIGHFPVAENPPLFADYLLPILEKLRCPN